MHDRLFKQNGWFKIGKIVQRLQIPVYRDRYMELSSMANFRMVYRGRMSDVKKYESEFKNALGYNTTVKVKDGFLNVIVPRPNPKPLPFEDIIESDFYKQCPGKLKIALGESPERGKVIGDLEEWEHILIAGMTGSGKSMTEHVIIQSLIRGCTPDDVKFVMIDPKKTELSYYKDISFLQMPIIHKTEEAFNTLKWVVNEIDKRYSDFEEANCRDIKSYNKSNTPLHHIVVIIDEFATLILRDKDNVENLLSQIAQIGRAAGVHLILATQRPTRDIVTGLIKANMTTRIALKVKEGIDSKNILDEMGAEELLGNGDMILQDKDSCRIQCCYLTEEEIQETCERYKVDRVESPLEDFEEIKTVDEEYKLFYRAVRHCLEEGKCNLATIYEAIRKGEKKQEEILQQMIDEGIVSTEKSYYGRNDILMSLDEFLEKYEEV